MSKNCAASCSIGCLFACQGCNAEKLRNAFAFAAPPPSYTLEEEQDASGAAPRLKMSYLLEGIRQVPFYHEAARHAQVQFISTAAKQSIPVVWVRNPVSSRGVDPGNSNQPLVMLHCHGNAADIGMMMGPYFEFSQRLGIEVVGVEYSGYGAATGRPSAKNTIADVEAAYDFVVAAGVPPERIVAYGQSVGSGPVTSLAATRALGGVILHSPLLSGIKVIDPQPDRCCRPSCVYCCFDFFPNDRNVRSARCPVFVIHGQRDEIVPFYHGYRLDRMAPRPMHWPGYFPAHAGHNDIVETNARAYFEVLSGFLRKIAEAAGAASVGPVRVSISKPPEQVEMASRPVTIGKTAEGGAQFVEPVVGPKDGRYDNIRRGRSQAGNAGQQAGMQAAWAAPGEGEAVEK